ncbi:MAG: FxsA family protein [Rhodospirillales bacterium]|jgi:UPF0716 protein FxsA|nr:FxsA family protein [Rhodospirillales bacterium]
MGLLILLAMIGVPIVEIAVFIKVGGWIGLAPTIATVVLTALIGTALLRRQGLATLMKVRENLAAGRLPVAEMFDGLCLLLAGALLLTPGFVTDAVGFLLFVPPVRAAVGRWLSAYLLSSGRVHVHADGPMAGGGPSRPPGGPPIIEGEYEELDADDRQPSGKNGDNPWRRGGR